MRTVLLFAAFVTACSASRPSPKEAPVAAAEPARAPLRGAVALERAEARALLCRVFDERDLDCDRRITVEDERAACAADSAGCAEGRWMGPYVVGTAAGELQLQELHQTAQLVQELVLGVRSGAPVVRLDLESVRKRPGAYLKDRIDRDFWDALTRRVDATPERLLEAAIDPKVSDGPAAEPDLCAGIAERCSTKIETATATAAAARTNTTELFVYYPTTDPNAREAFRSASIPGKLAVLELPARVTNAWLDELTHTRRHGLLTLALDDRGKGRPFVVPGGRFNEMYGWDSFFIVWGLVQSPERVELARSIVDNLAYEITQYGKILNANRTYYLTRSQPPFLTSSIREVWSRLPATDENRRWLGGVLAAAVGEYRKVWTSPPRRGKVCDGEACLARYYAEGAGEPPEVEPGHFDAFYEHHAKTHGHCAPPKNTAEEARFRACVVNVRERYRKGLLRDPLIDEFFKNDACMRESGHDTTYRFQVNGDERCTDYATVDLNALLFKTEIDLATIIEQVFGGAFAGETTKAFCRRAEARARLVHRHLWDEAAGLFFDYDMHRGRRSEYVSATTLYPLWASAANVCNVSLVTPPMAIALRNSALRELEAPGGLYATAPTSLARVVVPGGVAQGRSGDGKSPPSRQWEAPNGWAPHQMLAWEGLRRHGFPADAERLLYRWLSMIVRNAAEHHGTVPEKFDVKAQSHRVFAEYGNVNTTFSYIADEGFGWMNASFVVGWKELDEDARESLGD